MGMGKPTTCCDRERLRLLLANELPPDLEAETTTHIEGCPHCREALDCLAGDAAWWNEVRTCLREQGGPAGTDAPGECEGFSLVDFAVDFLEPCDQPDTLGKIDDVEILEVIGQGGMGIVLKGYQRALGRFVAVKVMAPYLCSSGSARKRFAREARAAAAIVHPHVMPIHSVNSSSRLPYLVMPFVACESLQQRIDREGPLELKEILRIGRQVASGLAAAHAQGLVHRDVKPANILLERGVDRVMLTDFGLARAVDDASLTGTGVIAGTPQFMSPEQARGEPVDGRSDLFSLGSVLYAMCTGRPPFRADNSFGVLRRISDDEPCPVREVNPDLPPWLEGVVVRLHAKNPAGRYQSGAELADLLEACLAHVQHSTVAPLPEALRSVGAPLPPTSRRKRAAKWIAALGAVCLLITAIVAAVYQPWADNAGRGGSQPVNTLPTQPTSSPAGTTSPRSVWNDGIAEEIESLQSDVKEFERGSP
jgi:serine/threonine-protein kinase